ncbi:MAG: hypothetical protein KA059_08745 [Elusimicrobiales bacterium]|jgi:hypothetical protein|nr:hypothetical protein [Elusimicrobiales bacterium]
MLDAIKEIGEFKRNKIGKDELSTLVENPNNNGIYKNVKETKGLIARPAL